MFIKKHLTERGVLASLLPLHEAGGGGGGGDSSECKGPNKFFKSSVMHAMNAYSVG